MKVFFLHRKGIVFFVLKYSYVFSPKDDRSTNEPFEVDEHGPISSPPYFLWCNFAVKFRMFIYLVRHEKLFNVV